MSALLEGVRRSPHRSNVHVIRREASLNGVDPDSTLAQYLLGCSACVSLSVLEVPRYQANVARMHFPVKLTDAVKEAICR